ncbi:MAG TPA: 2'-deoxycytidine 5'-triphosphate deaminase, partial [Thermopetrobacter sp.]|nr:2'-deoxycytidine 5'-triphosphate deaminase [Thermopetrobacter sp.]
MAGGEAGDGAARAGILPAHVIRRMVEEGRISAPPACPVARDQVQPASLDLRLGETAYRVRASFLPGRGRTVRERLEELALHAFPLAEGAVLETGCVYIVPLLEGLRLPADVSAAA